MFTHSKNSHFQYAAFIAGRCHTADEAHRILRDQWEDRDVAIKTFEASLIRQEAKREKAAALAEDPTAKPWERLEAKADVIEIEAKNAQARACYDEAVRERAFLEELIASIQPYRKYAHLPDYEAMQACQREEWRLEFMTRIENYMMTSGTVPADQLAAMRQHPDFHTAIYPYLLECRKAVIEKRLPGTAWKKPPFHMVLERAAQMALPAAERQLQLPEPDCGCHGKQKGKE